jgi:hypothetical protein
MRRAGDAAGAGGMGLTTADSVPVTRRAVPILGHLCRLARREGPVPDAHAEPAGPEARRKSAGLQPPPDIREKAIDDPLHARRAAILDVRGGLLP